VTSGCYWRLQVMVGTGFVDHVALLRHCDVMLSHAGAGTFAAGLLAGCAQLCIPMFFDQPFWAARAEELGMCNVFVCQPMRRKSPFVIPGPPAGPHV
jgi:hypothetical protein